MKKYQKYRPGPVVDLADRKWPGRVLEKAPVWCSVDLRDRNQALLGQAGLPEKMELFRLLVRLGFEEIEIGSPASTDAEYAFLRHLSEKDLLPENVTLQVLSTGNRRDIEATFEALAGCKRAILRLYSMEPEKETPEEAGQAAAIVRSLADAFPGRIRLEYSLNGFAGMDLSRALEISRAVLEAFEPTPSEPLILGLPGGTELHMPNVFADQVEWMRRHLDPERVVLSVRPHNDRGMAAAAAELALLAGAGRVEGTLFGTGERAGSADLVTLALNLLTQGIDPGLTIDNMTEIVDICQRCTGMRVGQRHPYAGRMVFTPFSRSHQEAVSRGMKESGDVWQVPYMIIDPRDIGRVYNPLVRADSEAAEPAVIMEREYGFKLPGAMRREFSETVRRTLDPREEMKPERILEIFRSEYIRNNEPYHFRRLQVTDLSGEGNPEFDTRVKVTYSDHGAYAYLQAAGKGPLDAIQRGLAEEMGFAIRILDYEEHALQSGSDSQAAAYIHMMDVKSGKTTYGVGVSSNITRASARAVFSGLNRFVQAREGLIQHS